MIFNSISFILFFPIVTFVYFILPHPMRNIWLLCASCFFYMYSIPLYIFIILIVIMIDYLSALLIYRTEDITAKTIFYFSIISNCLILFVFKYFDFFNTNLTYIANYLNISWGVSKLNLALPLGISFYTFQSMGYVIDVYKKKLQPEKSFFTYALYVIFYPQLVAGPIEKAAHLIPQLHKKHKFNYQNTVEGLRLMLWGMFQKVVVADRLGALVDMIYADPSQYEGLQLILATLFFFVQIYCDFCGYSDIAVGCARVMGFEITLNFNCPMAAKTLSGFWSRWHITMMRWFMQYIYYPLNRHEVFGKFKRLNLMIVFILSGLWHGANWTFIVFGFIHGGLMVMGTYFKRNSILKKIQIKSTIVTFITVCLTAVFFRAETLKDAFYIITHMNIRISNIIQLQASCSQLGISRFDLIVDLFLVMIIFFIQYMIVKSGKKYQDIILIIDKIPRYLRWALYYVIIFSILFLGRFEHKQFIYFHF